jgi:predicted DNA-binding transcriptional regulator YafY
MNRQLDIPTRHRAIKVLKDLIEYPYHYTIQDLANQNDVSKDTIRDDIEGIKNAGFETTFDKNYRYAVIYSKPLEYIKDMLFLSETEYHQIREALKKSTAQNRAIEKTLQKLESIYDYTKYGNQTISKVYLKKVNLLEKAKLEKQKLKLINYRSTNSKKAKDRTVEVFHISAKEDTLQAYDPEHHETRIFRISRFERLEQLDEDWENEGKHHVLHPDIFGIVDKITKHIHIKMDIAALNALLDRYPLAKAYTSPAADEPNVHELECNVNAAYIGLTNYLLGNHDHIIEIIEPQGLIDTLNEKIKSMRF